MEKENNCSEKDCNFKNGICIIDDGKKRLTLCQNHLTVEEKN